VRCRLSARGGDAGERLEIEREVARGLKALLRILLEAVPHDPLDAGRNVRVRQRDLGRIFLEDRGHRVGRRVSLERPLAREHLVEDRAEREDVRARVRRPSAHLLRGHVAERAEDDAGLCRARGRAARRGRHVRRRRFRFRLDELGQTEIEDLDPRRGRPGSCSKRRSRSASAERDDGRTLIATSRPSRGSRARQTSPMPPAPMAETTS
jgi:hypothetical protein